jgi:beta-phosphoglucomutase
MNWIYHYQLFLFDFDGILVNTEHLHYKAYLKMCADRGFRLNWDEKTYMRYAMYTAEGIKEGIHQELPALEKQEPCWDVLYQEKKAAYLDLLVTEGVSLMPGVEELLIALKHANIKRCVVTHSTIEHIASIRKQQPILDSIPVWITREDYKEPKPSSECYIKAISMLSSPGERMIGFEDSPRGLTSLLGTSAQGVWVTHHFGDTEVKELVSTLGKEFKHFSSFVDIATAGISP